MLVRVFAGGVLLFVSRARWALTSRPLLAPPPFILPRYPPMLLAISLLDMLKQTFGPTRSCRWTWPPTGEQAVLRSNSFKPTLAMPVSLLLSPVRPSDKLEKTVERVLMSRTIVSGRTMGFKRRQHAVSVRR